jgi:hypothetical protein
MKIRITGKDLPKAQKGLYGTGPILGLPITKFAMHEPDDVDDLISFFDPTGLSNLPYVTSSARKLINEPGWKNKALNTLGLAWNVLGSIPIYGKITKIGKSPKVIGGVKGLGAKLIDVPYLAGKKVFQAVDKTGRYPSKVLNKGIEKVGLHTPGLFLNPFGQYNRGQRLYEAGYNNVVPFLDWVSPGKSEQKAYGGEPEAVRVRITGKGLPKAQYQNSIVGIAGKPTFNTEMSPTFKGMNSAFQQGVSQSLGKTCPDGQQKNPFTGKCEPISSANIPASPQVKTDLGEGFIRNPITGTYGMPEPISNINFDTTSPFKNKTFVQKLGAYNYALNAGLNLAETASNFFNNKDVDRQFDLKYRRDMLPDNQLVEKRNKGMWTVNEGWQNPDLQYTVNQGQMTNQFHPRISYAEDGLQVPRQTGDLYLPSTPISLPADFFNVPVVQQKAPVPQSYSSGPVSSEASSHKFAPKGRKYNRNTIIDPSEITVLDANQMDADAVLDTLAATEKSKTGGRTQLVGPEGQRATAMGRWGIVEGTRKGLFNKHFKQSMSWNEFENAYNTDPNFERQVAKSLVNDLLPKYGSLIFGAWYDPTFTNNFLKGKTGVLNKIPREDYGNEITWGGYLKKAQDKYFRIKNNLPASEEGGETDEDMKIRILETPDSEETPSMSRVRIVGTPNQEMAYGGQSGYGFDLGQRNTYSKMTDNTYENASNTIQEVPREEANIEAEKGETAYGDMDGDGMNEHMKIGGKRHTQGGTPLNVPEGTFIYSDTKKMIIKDPNVLKMFGMSPSKKGYTPAEIAKKYDVNKYKAVLQDPYSDNISKNTAKKMIDNYEEKLAYLSVVQESMKGFPQGIPKVAENIMGGGMSQESPQPQQQSQEEMPQEEMRYGGLPKYQGTQNSQFPPEKEFDYNKRKIRAKFFPRASGVPGGYNPTPIKDLYEKPGVAGTSQTIAAGAAPSRGSSSFNRAFANARNQGLGTFVWNGKTYTTDLYDPKGKVVTTPGTEPEYVYTGDEPSTTPTGGGTGKIEEKPSDKKEEAPKVSPVQTNVPFMNPPYGWLPEDKLSALNALLNRSGIKKEPFDYVKATPYVPDVTLEDWKGAVQNVYQGVNTAARALQESLPGQSLAANLSYLQGQTGENVANIINGVNTRNLGVYNRYQENLANIMNNAAAYNANVVNTNRENRWNINDKYRREKRLADTALTQALGTGMTNAAKLYNMNITESPYYFINPKTGLLTFNPYGGRAAFEAMKRQELSGSTPENAKAYIDNYNQILQNIEGTPEEKHRAAQTILNNMIGRRSGYATTYPYNPSKNNTRIPVADADQQLSYAYGGYAYHNPFLR